jgi:hypothetical protein
MNQLRYKINKAGPADIIFSPEQIMGNKRDVIYCTDKLPGFSQDKYYDLYDILKNVVGSDDPKFSSQTEEGEILNLLPVRKLSVPVDINTVKDNGTVHETDQIVNELHLDIPKRNYILKSDLTILSLIASNHWKRPICFTSKQDLNNLGLDKYVRSTGLCYRLVPVENQAFDDQLAFKTIMEKFVYGNADKNGIYYDEENRRRLNIIRLAHAELAISLVQNGKKESARQVLEKFDQNVKESNFPYGMVSNRGNQHDIISTQFLEACYLAGDLVLAKKVTASLRKDLLQQLRYYQSLGEDNGSDEQLANNAYLLLQGKGNGLAEKQIPFAGDILSSFQILQQMGKWENQYGIDHPASELNKHF